jgi:hypothetical protein
MQKDIFLRECCTSCKISARENTSKAGCSVATVLLQSIVMTICCAQLFVLWSADLIALHRASPEERAIDNRIKACVLNQHVGETNRADRRRGIHQTIIQEMDHSANSSVSRAKSGRYKSTMAMSVQSRGRTRQRHKGSGQREWANPSRSGERTGYLTTP